MADVEVVKEIDVSIPLKSGHIVTSMETILRNEPILEVSIPLKSGHIVTVFDFLTDNGHIEFQSP